MGETMAKAAKGKKFVKVTQVRSRIGSTRRQCAVLDGMGLRRRGRSVVLEDTAAIRGMIAKVQHLVDVEENATPSA